MAANDKQVGGSHYKGEIQHWDLVHRTGTGYFIGQVTKYLSRWRKKNGVEDLLKSDHYAQKLEELTEEAGAPLDDALTMFQIYHVLEFCCLGDYDRDERRLLLSAFTMRSVEDIKKFRDSLSEFVNSLPRGRVL